jgi:hypothetical protein
MTNDRLDHELGLWLGGPTDRLPETVLRRTFHVTARTRQRPALLASLGGTPTMRPSTTRLSATRPILVAAVLMLLLATALLLVGRLLEQRQVVIAPAPSVEVASDAPLSPEAAPTVRPGTVYRVPGSTAEFAMDLPPDWRVARDDETTGEGLRINTRYELVRFDPVPAAWVIVSVDRRPLEDVRMAMASEGWSGTPEAIDVPGLVGILLTAGPNTDLDPTALVAAEALTYRIAAHDSTTPNRGSFYVRDFLRRFTPLGIAAGEGAYRDDGWGFAFAYAASPTAFLPGVDIGAGTTRFAAADCGVDKERTCDRFVDVVRLPT